MIMRHAILALMFSVHGISNSTVNFVNGIGSEIHFPSSFRDQMHCCPNMTSSNCCISF